MYIVFRFWMALQISTEICPSFGLNTVIYCHLRLLLLHFVFHYHFIHLLMYCLDDILFSCLLLQLVHDDYYLLVCC